MSKVFVTGATGFLAQHLINQLLEKDYHVVGTVRSTEKGDLLVSLFKNPRFEYEVVRDLGSKDDFDKALKKHNDVTAVLHTASPVFPSGMEDPEKDMVVPAINGTRNVLKSVKEHGPKVKKFVYTSSLAAVRTEQSYSRDEIVTEDSWNNVTLEDAKKDEGLAYEVSKTHAEKEVWNFIKENNPKFDVTIINPVYIFGPQLFDYYVKTQLNFSNEIINSILQKKDKQILGYSVDVRDVAKAHVSAIEDSATNGQRLITTSGDPYNQQTILDIIHRNFSGLKDVINVGNPGSDKKVFAEYYTLNNSKTKKILKFDFVPQEKTIVDTVSQILQVQGTPKL